LITPRTRGLILNTPHNPTGAVYSADVLTKIAHFALQHELTCIFDECYDELVYAPSVHANIVRLVPEMKARTILIGSLSKTYCIAGWRAGHIAAPKPIIKAVSNLQSHTASNPSNLIQYAALAALDPVNDAFVSRIRQQLTAQRQTALQLIAKVPLLSCVVPTGAFYLFPDVRHVLTKSFKGQPIENVERLAEMLLEHAHVAVVPGSAFGADRHLRISYAIPVEEIITGLTRLEQFVRSLS
jgi:aspartate aminotransferase